MPCTLSQAHDQILALLPAAITALPTKYPDIAAPAGFPPKASSWARVSLSDVDGGAVSIGSPARYESEGLLTVEIYALAGDGRAKAQELAEAVLSAYRGKSTSGGVFFRRERVVDVGPDGAWYHVNALIEYRYHTIQ
jgi:hypothetical protein